MNLDDKFDGFSKQEENWYWSKEIDLILIFEHHQVGLLKLIVDNLWFPFEFDQFLPIFKFRLKFELEEDWIITISLGNKDLWWLDMIIFNQAWWKSENWILCYINGDSKNKRITVIDGSYQFVGCFGSFSGSSLNLSIDSFDRIAVSDGYNCLYFYDSIGELNFKFGSKGNEIGQFNFPSGVCFDENDRLVVCDFDNHRLQVIWSELKEEKKDWRIKRN